MTKKLLILFCLFSFMTMHAQTDVIVTPKPKDAMGGQRSPLLMPSIYYDDGAVCVTYPYTTVMTVSVCKNDGSFYIEQTFYAVSTACISGLEPGIYSLTVVIGGMVYEGEFETESEFDEE